MKMSRILLLFFIAGASAFFNPYPKRTTKYFTQDIEPRLVLTPYIQSGEAKLAKDLSLVTSLTPNITSYAGFFTVDEKCDSNLFFWFFPSQNDWLSDPVSVWLNGGPGSTSLYGLLTENGPYTLSLDGKLELREHSWNRNSSVIYIDNPVGAGFSYTGSEDCYATDEVQVGQSVKNALEQFFEVFPELAKNPFYLTGESYAGKYIPAIAYAIHTSDPKSPINLQGFAIGDGWVDPENQQLYDEYLYQIGLIDINQRKSVGDLQKVIVDFIREGYFAEANDLSNYLLGGIFAERAGFDSLYNFLYERGEPEADIDTFLDSAEVRKAIHVGNATWNDGGMVYDKLYADVLKSVKPWLEVLLDNYRVLIFNGQLDIIVAYPLTLGYLQKLQWSGAEQYKTQPRELWYVGEELAGYLRTVGNFTEALVRNAGHMVPTDQPAWALDLYNRFIHNDLNLSKD